MEFIIQRTDGDYFDLDANLFADALHPNSVPYIVIEGWGNHRIEALGCQIAFSDEIVGIQVGFVECSISDEEAQKLVEEVLHNIEAITGQRGEVIQTD